MKKSTGSPSVISCHRLEHKHDFDWDKVEILDMEPHYRKRIVSEMIYIKKQPHELNKYSNMDLLSYNYLPILNQLFPF